MLCAHDPLYRAAPPGPPAMSPALIGATREQAPEGGLSAVRPASDALRSLMESLPDARLVRRDDRGQQMQPNFPTV